MVKILENKVQKVNYYFDRSFLSGYFYPGSAEFDNALANAGDQLVVVDFTATWCGPCQMIKPIFEALSGEFPDVQFFKVDVDANSETAEAEGISAMPTFKFYKNGKKVDSFSGANKEKLKEYIHKYK